MCCTTTTVRKTLNLGLPLPLGDDDVLFVAVKSKKSCHEVRGESNRDDAVCATRDGSG